MKGLIIKDPWITKILNGEKIWEIRGNNTKIRGKIYLIKSGTQKIYGEIELINSIFITEKIFEDNKEKHQVKEFNEIKYNKTYAWVLQNPIIYDNPIPYKHKRGCVIWINI